ncbi:hypothetical protein PPL_11073 [Heterostelium album PN500]|uniref:Ankyrin repeat protein n=1 Tax=Heterostelium pallidum (strain ATCC 26659 / Pp 5 / PN500) TaxID=670386 RepID=D3BSV3_HETP5|nr:hypothetical protein PPL_11073 [Heterostelium album PN500]EFA75568.1 hypothetical protein PPL_11073 [Heterostelium album PN500]|eukprot:XP_020427702.1 hypothetical protein PPL_11073 [Heterostelium album PN500]
MVVKKESIFFYEFCFLLRKEIFKKVKYINRDILKYNSYKWNVIKNKPSYLAAYNYFHLLKKYFKEIASKKNKWYEHLFGSGTLNGHVCRVMLVSIKYGHLETLKYFIKKYSIKVEEYMRQFMVMAVRNGRLEIVKYLDSLGLGINKYTYRSMIGLAPLGLNFELLVWIAENKLADIIHLIVECIKIAMRSAAEVGRLDMLQYLMNKTLIPLANEADHCILQSAVQGGNVEMVEWLLQGSLSFNPMVNYIDTAALSGHLAMVKYLHHHNYGVSSRYLLYKSVQSGNLELVQWVYENLSTNVTSKFALNVAAEQGFLHVLQWINEHRNEGSSTTAIDKASWVSLSVVQWLHENRTEGCTSNAIEYALKAGHLDIAEYLFTNIPDKSNQKLFTISTLITSIEENIENNEILIFLLEHRHQLFKTEISYDDLIKCSKSFKNSKITIKSFKDKIK